MRFGFRERVDRHDLLRGEKTEKSKANARRTKKGGAPARGGRAADSLRADIFVFMYLWDLRSLLRWLQREWLKTNTRRDSSRFQPHRRSRRPANKKNGRCCWGCGNTCNKFTVTSRSAGNASSLQLKKIQSYYAGHLKRCVISATVLQNYILLLSCFFCFVLVKNTRKKKTKKLDTNLDYLLKVIYISWAKILENEIK